jgi:predicted nucleotidyltransferase
MTPSVRLTKFQTDNIRRVARRVLGEGARVTLFGSRAVDGTSGGDIDLLFETDTVLPNRADALCHLHGALILALGERKIDIILKDAATPTAPVFEIARRTGVLL